MYLRILLANQSPKVVGLLTNVANQSPKVHRTVRMLCVAVCICLMFAACGSQGDEPVVEWNPDIQLPQTIEVERGSNCVLTQRGGAVTDKDEILLERQGRVSVCRIVSAGPDVLEFLLPADVADGSCILYVRHGERRVKLGTTQLRVVTVKIKPDAGTTVYGIVQCQGQPVQGVVVTDGLTSTVTDSRGVYQLRSDKEAGWVSISVPAGYEPELDGCLPKIHHRLTSPAAEAEYADFKLVKADSQQQYTLLFMGDMHLANRSKDLQQFADFVSDVKGYMAANPGHRYYAVTLGDMSWDTYWSKNKFGLPEYRNTLLQSFSQLPVYQTMGNHDHDPMASGANNAPVGIFTAQIAPAWYSFNIGACHYVVLDNIDTSAYQGTGTSDYTERIYGRQLQWLRDDLSHVATDCPLFIIMHANVFSGQGAGGFVMKSNNANYQELLDIVRGRTVHIVTGHAHQSHTVTPADAVMAGRGKVYEHNLAAVCGDWWYSGYYTPGSNISTDGTPYGYGIWQVNGKDIKWKYKGTGLSQDLLFRAYDLNQVHFSTDVFDVLKTPAVIADFKRRYVDTYANRRNEILVNVWGWDNEGWDIKIELADGTPLTVKRLEAYDPLSIRSLSIPYYNRSNLTDVPGTKTTLRHHFFSAVAPDADSKVIITVTDRRNGTVQRQEMTRPMAF